MAVGVDVSVLAGHDVLDPAGLVAGLASASLPGDIQIAVLGNSVRVRGQRPSTLAEVTGPLVTWWQAHRPQADLHLETAGGELRLTARAGDAAAAIVRHFLEHESGRIHRLDDAGGRPTGGRRRVARDFTARVVGTSRDDGILSVGVAEDDTGTGRSLILQGADPTTAGADSTDPDEEPYCLITETTATVYGGLTAITLRDRTLRLQLTRTAAKTLGVAPTLTITLDVNRSAIADLRSGIRDVFAHGTRRSAPTLDLD